MTKKIFDTTTSTFHKLESLQFSLPSWLNSWYPQICSYLGIDPLGDTKALENILQDYESNVSIENLNTILNLNKNVIAVAPGIELEKEFEIFQYLFEQEDTSVISADGSTSFLLEKNVIPDLIVSDLDGKIEDQITALEEGSILAVHVHGDNETTVKNNLQEISKHRFLLTTQSSPLAGTYNFFGFTDGDRAVCLATKMKVATITLIGFDFGPEIGKYSKIVELNQEMKDRKLKKFVIGKSIINWCANTGQKIIFPTH